MRLCDDHCKSRRVYSHSSVGSLLFRHGRVYVTIRLYQLVARPGIKYFVLCTVVWDKALDDHNKDNDKCWDDDGRPAQQPSTYLSIQQMGDDNTWKTTQKTTIHGRLHG